MVSRADISKGEGLIRSHELFEHLINDVCKSFEILGEQRESQYHRRTVVRTVFSFVEGVVSILKYELRSDIRMRRYEYDLSKKEKEVLYEIKEHDGEEKNIFIPIDLNIKKTFKLAVSVWSVEDFRLNTDGLEYDLFIQAKATRNRLTHPRTYYDLQVTDDEMASMECTFNWVRVSFGELFKRKVADLTKDFPDDIRERLMNA
jgi:hypothetical protein